MSDFHNLLIEKIKQRWTRNNSVYKHKENTQPRKIHSILQIKQYAKCTTTDKEQQKHIWNACN